MDPFDRLEDEHRLIEQVLSALVLYAGSLPDGAAPGDLAMFVEFLTDFADARHHAKEEGILFEAMIRAGFPRKRGPVATMVSEHDQARELVAILREASARAGSWTPDDHARIGDTARALARLLRAHIQKEDGVLYPTARHNLTDETFRQIARLFDEIEGSDEARIERGTLESIARILVSRYPTTPTPRLEPMLATWN